jgi:sulfoxide reductase catalytic subunit YedY
VLLKRSPDLKYSDVTPEDVYLNRRKFLYGMGLSGGLALAGKSLANIVDPSIRAYASTKLDGVIKGPFSTDEKVTPEKNATTYNNYYEFGTEKDEPAKNSQKFQTSP